MLLEGGGTLNGAMLEAGLVQCIQAYIAPKLFGGPAGKAPVGGTGVALPEQAFRLKNAVVTQIGEDILVEGEVEQDVHRNC